MQYKALEIIHDEHRALAAMLNGMRTIAVGIRDGRLKMDFGLYAAMLRYMEEVPEKLHHPKEGEYLFARLRQWQGHKQRPDQPDQGENAEHQRNAKHHPQAKVLPALHARFLFFASHR